MTEYVRNVWYPLTWSRDVNHSLSSHTILEENVVLFRDSQGQVVAMEDVCPHRLAPLSIGTLVDDTIQCGYHGLRFGCDGRCVHVPGQKRAPESIRVKAYPVAENMGLVWIWMGDGDKADVNAIFDLPEYHDPAFSVFEGDGLVLSADYLSLAENLCDPSHVAFVHQSTLANKEHGDVPVQHQRLEDRVVTWRWILDSPIIPIFKGLKPYHGNVDRWHYYHYYCPSIAIIDFGTAPTGTGAPEGDRSECIQMFACHFITPVDSETCIQHWLLVKNMPSDPEIDQRLKDGLRIAFNEDKVVLEAIQRNEKRFTEVRPVRLAIDASSMKMRKMVSEMIELERQAS